MQELRVKPVNSQHNDLVASSLTLRADTASNHEPEGNQQQKARNPFARVFFFHFPANR
jgi:hypothetical protein